MCHKTTCSTCQKTTWWGCGNHIPSVMDSVPTEEWCTCEPKKKVNVNNNGDTTKEKEYPPGGSPMGALPGMFSWIFGRK